MSEFAPSSGQRILDAGCGDGRFLHELKCQVDDVLTGVDYSEMAIAFAKVINPAIDFQIGDLTEQIPFNKESFDQVVLIETLEHIKPDRVQDVLREISRVLKEGGTLVITVPHKNRKLDNYTSIITLFLDSNFLSTTVFIMAKK